MYGESTAYAEKAVARDTQVAEQCISIEQWLESLSKTVEHLEMRLSKVLQSDAENMADGSVPEVLLVPLADTLRGYSKALLRLDARLTNLTQRLEV